MDNSQVIEVAFKALTMAFVLCGPVLIALLIVGLIIGVLQAATSINESSVAFIPKLIVIAVVLLLVGPSTLALFVDYLREVISDFPTMLR
jgi:flagellar biosynthetic protein FliQ